MRDMKRLIFNGVRFCKKCGDRMLFQGYDMNQRISYIMDLKQYCYNCAYWEDLAKYKPKYFQVINGKCYKVFPLADKKDKSLMLGNKGRLRYFIKPDLTLIKTNDVWLIGTIPETHKHLFPDTLMEIKACYSGRFTDRKSKKCKAKSCLDRYDCLRYDLNQEKNGPFNTIPKNWKLGDERCKYYMSKTKILIL